MVVEFHHSMGQVNEMKDKMTGEKRKDDNVAIKNDNLAPRTRKG